MQTIDRDVVEGIALDQSVTATDTVGADEFQREAVFRKAIFERDRWTCRVSGKTVDTTELHCAHIVARSQAPERKHDPENAITLSRELHEAQHRGELRLEGASSDLKCWRKEGELWVQFTPASAQFTPANLPQELVIWLDDLTFFDRLEEYAKNWSDQALVALFQMGEEQGVKSRIATAMAAHTLAARKQLTAKSKQGWSALANELGKPQTPRSIAYLHELSWFWGKMKDLLEKRGQLYQGVSWTMYLRAARAPDPPKALAWAESYQQQYGGELTVQEFNRAIRLGLPELQALHKQGLPWLHCSNCIHYRKEEMARVQLLRTSDGVAIAQQDVYKEAFCAKLKHILRYCGDLQGKAAWCKERGYFEEQNGREKAEGEDRRQQPERSPPERAKGEP